MLPSYTVNEHHGIRTPDLLFRSLTSNLFTTVPLFENIENYAQTLDLVCLNNVFVIQEMLDTSLEWLLWNTGSVSGSVG